MSWQLSLLNRDLAREGQQVTLRRVSGVAPSTTNVDVSVRAFVRSPTSSELDSGVAQTDSMVIMSPTEIATAGWPAGESASSTVADPSLPRRDDKILISGRWRNVEHVNPFVIDDTLVRIELQVRG